MGGTVAVTLRTEDGKEHRMARWTNIFPETVHNLEFLSGDLSYWDESLKRFYDMKQDWDDNHEEYEKRQAERPDDYEYQDVFQFPMTPCYGDYTNLAPEGYGLIVLDQKNKKILEMQGYTHFGDMMKASISMAMDWDTMQEIRDGKVSVKDCMEHLRKNTDYNVALDFYDLCEAGKVVAKASYNRDLGDFETFSLQKGISTEQIFKHEILDEKRGMDRYVLDLSPYTVERFDEDSEGAIQMRKRVLELGFVLSDEEEKIWQEWINDNLEQENEDDGF